MLSRPTPRLTWPSLNLEFVDGGMSHEVTTLAWLQFTEVFRRLAERDIDAILGVNEHGQINASDSYVA